MAFSNTFLFATGFQIFLIHTYIVFFFQACFKCKMSQDPKDTSDPPAFEPPKAYLRSLADLLFFYITCLPTKHLNRFWSILTEE